jgi:dienelactone hydrolase
VNAFGSDETGLASSRENVAQLRQELAALVRFPLSGSETPPPIDRTEEQRPDFVVERLAWPSERGEVARAILVRPPGPGPHPAVLYCHAHGGRYEIGLDELLDGRSSLLSPYGPVLAAAGFAALCVEMPAFGTRQEPGEGARTKERLWFGDTLFGAMLRDLRRGLAHLRSRRDVDGTRIATLGLSMGATHAFWMAALDPGIDRTAHLCCYADIAGLVRSGRHDRHGHYMTVPGLLNRFSTGSICGLIAPRPQLVGVGYQDPLTPREEVAAALAQTRPFYEAADAREHLVLVEHDDTGHTETPAMREAVLRFLAEMKA